MTETDLPPAMLRGVHMERLMPSLGQRERATLGGMVVAGKIGTAELVAANRWFRDWAMAEHGAFEGGDNVKPSEALKMFPAETMAAARTALRDACEVIGAADAALIVQIVCHGISMRAIAGRGGRAAMNVHNRVGKALGGLAEHYTATDDKRRKCVR